MTRILSTATFAAACLIGIPAHAEVVGKVRTDWVGNDIVIEAIQDPKVQGVTCHLTYFERSLIDRLPVRDSNPGPSD